MKYHALGNDYLVYIHNTPAHEPVPSAGWVGLSADVIQRICDRHRGVGADGILVPMPAQAGHYAVRIFNPDGSEAEKSDNGLRIFARASKPTRASRSAPTCNLCVCWIGSICNWRFGNAGPATP